MKKIDMKKFIWKNINHVFEKGWTCIKIFLVYTKNVQCVWKFCKKIYIRKKNHFSKMVKGELKTVPYVQTNVKFIWKKSRPQKYFLKTLLM